MRYCKKILAVPAIMVIAWGCVTDTIYNTDHPGQAKVTIITDWSDRGSEVAKPSDYTVETAGLSETAFSDTFIPAKYFDPGNYTFRLFSQVQEIPVTEAVAKVNTTADITYLPGTFIEALPGWLFTGTAVAELAEDTDHTLSVKMRQQVRQLTVIIEPEGEGAQRITSVIAELTGVAGAWDIVSDSPSGEEAKVFPEFTKGSDGKWAATVRLLGVTGNNQKLAGIISLDDGLTDQITLESDLSEPLSAFNNDKKTPLSISGKVTVDSERVEAGFTATIVEWEKVVEGNAVAN